MRTYRAQKAALTRAQNVGDPYKIMEEGARFFREYRDADQPLPDDWHRWDRAMTDAWMQAQWDDEGRDDI